MLETVFNRKNNIHNIYSIYNTISLRRGELHSVCVCVCVCWGYGVLDNSVKYVVFGS